MKYRGVIFGAVLMAGCGVLAGQSNAMTFLPMGVEPSNAVALPSSGAVAWRTAVGRAAGGAQGGAGQASAAGKPVLGTVKEITGKNIVLTVDAGGEVSVAIQDGARLLRIEPGERDLRKATPLELSDLQVGDRVLVRGKTAEDGKSVAATSVIAMKRTDIAAKQAHERDEWQRHGVGGLVSSVDPAAGNIVVATMSAAGSKSLVIHVGGSTVLRRYAAGSVKFDDAKVAPIDEIRAGDQLRARGTRSADGNELTADEIVSGSFRNIAGTISAIDAAAGTMTVMDLATKKAVVVKVTAESQLRKLSPIMAQGIAARFKAAQADGAAAGSAAAGQKPAEPPSTGGAGAGAGGAANGQGGAGRGGRGPGGGGDLQQAISRMPAATLADLKNGDAVMIVTTIGGANGEVTAITLLAGVEPILQASPKGGESILSPWSLSGGAAGGDAPTP
jgi:hypothetical protein